MALFGSQKNTPSNSISETVRSNDNAGGGLTCVIAQGTVIEGKFVSSENIRLDGTIKGHVKCDKKLVMGDTGLIEGNIEANSIAIMGKIVGDLKISDGIHLQSKGNIKGNIVAKSMMVDEGGVYQGELKIGDKKK